MFFLLLLLYRSSVNAEITYNMNEKIYQVIVDPTHAPFL